MSTRATVSVVGLFLVVGCGEEAISTQPLAGKIGGQAWSFGAGETNSTQSTADELWVDLYPTTFETCVAFGAPTDVNHVLMVMPRTPGSYDLNFTLNATLYVASTVTNYAATSGRLVIDSVTATTISGGLRATYNGDNTVDGQFQAAICP